MMKIDSSLMFQVIHTVVSAAIASTVHCSSMNSLQTDGMMMMRACIIRSMGVCEDILVDDG